MSSPPEPSASPESTVPALRVLVLAFAGALAIMTVLSTIALPLGDADTPSPVLLLAFALAPLLGLLLIEAIGFRTAPLGPGDVDGGPDRVQQVALVRYRTGQMLRLALAEAPVLVLFVLGFVLTYGPWPLLAGILPGIAVLVLEAWPSRRNVRRVADALEAEGTRSYLPEAFGHA